jgi:glyoxylase I family protein
VGPAYVDALFRPDRSVEVDRLEDRHGDHPDAPDTVGTVMSIRSAHVRYAPTPAGSAERDSAAHGPNELPGLDSVQPMPIKLDNVGIAVRDLEATIAFFTDLGLTVLGRDTVSGEWTDTAVGLDGNHAKIAMLQTPDGNGRLELFEYIHPDAIETQPTRPNEIGMHRVAFSVDDLDEALETAARHGCHPLRGVATYEDVYKLTYVRGPSGILVMLAEELQNS